MYTQKPIYVNRYIHTDRCPKTWIQTYKDMYTQRPTYTYSYSCTHSQTYIQRHVLTKTQSHTNMYRHV